MSFYGKVIRPLEKVFQSLKFGSKGSQNYDFNSNTEDVVLEAGVAADRAVMQTGNAWIGFNATENRNEIAIYHNAPSGSASSVVPFDWRAQVQPEGTINQMAFGDYFIVNSFEHDKAGHIFADKLEQQIYKLPSLGLDGISNIGEQFDIIFEAIGTPVPFGDNNIVSALADLNTRFDSLNTEVTNYSEQIESIDSRQTTLENQHTTDITTLTDADKAFVTQLGTLSKIQVDTTQNIGIADVIGTVSTLKSGDNVVWGDTDTLVSIIWDLSEELLAAQDIIKMHTSIINTLETRISALETASENS